MSTVDPPRAGVAPAVMGMVLFIASEAMFFGGLFAAYFAVRSGQTDWPPAGTPAPGGALPFVFTAALVASSLTQHRAAHAARTGDAGRAGRWVAITVTLGAIFLAGQAWEWSELSHAGLHVGGNAFGTMFYVMTGAHGLHVLGGLMMLAAVGLRVRTGLLERRGPALVDAATFYWHFVDVVWIVLFVTLYVPV